MKRSARHLVGLIAATIVLTGALSLLYFGVKNNVSAETIAASPSALADDSPSAAQNDSNQNIDEIIASANNNLSSYGIEIGVPKTTSAKQSNWQNIDTSDTGRANVFANLVLHETQRYPVSTIKKSGLKKIYLVKSLRVDDQLRSGMPEPFVEDALYFDITENYIKSENGQYMKRVFHHELSHLIDYNQSGTFTPYDSKWLSCNTPGWRYGKGGASMAVDPQYAHKSHPAAGFINGYATSAVEEDKAEMFALTVLQDQNLDSLSKVDTSLACKKTRVELQLASLR